MRTWWVLLVVPLAMGAVLVGQGLEVQVAARAPLATLGPGDQGAATVGASRTSATVSVADAAILASDDVLRISSADPSWQVRARYVSHTGFTGASTSLTLSLSDGVLAREQVVVASGAASRTAGVPVDLAVGKNTELRAATTLLASGTVTLQLEIVPDSGVGPVMKYRVTLIVT